MCNCQKRPLEWRAGCTKPQSATTGRLCGCGIDHTRQPLAKRGQAPRSGFSPSNKFVGTGNVASLPSGILCWRRGGVTRPAGHKPLAAHDIEGWSNTATAFAGGGVTRQRQWLPWQRTRQELRSLKVRHTSPRDLAGGLGILRKMTARRGKLMKQRGSKPDRTGFLACSWYNFPPLAASFNSHLATAGRRVGNVTVSLAAACCCFPRDSARQKRFLDIAWHGGNVAR